MEGILNSRCPVVADREFPEFSVADSGGSTSTISPFLRRLEPGAWRIPRGNVENHTLGGRLSFPEISGKYLDRAV